MSADMKSGNVSIFQHFFHQQIFRNIFEVVISIDSNDKSAQNGFQNYHFFSINTSVIKYLLRAFEFQLSETITQ